MSLGRRMFHGASIGLLEHCIKVAALFISTPIMAHYLGQEGYGMWLLGMSILTYLAIVDMGLTFSATRFLAVAVGSGDQQRQAAVIAVSGRYFRIMGWTVTLGSLSVLWLIPWLLPGKSHVWDLMLAILFCGVTLSLRFHFRMPGLLLRAHVRYDLQAWASIIRVVAQTTAMCLVLFRDGGLLGVGLVHGLGDCLELALQAAFARRLRISVYAPAADDDRLAELRKDLFHYTRDMLLNSVGNTFRTQVGPMVIGKLRGAAEVSIYSVSTRVLGILHDVTNAMFGGIVLTAFGQLHGAEDKKRLNREFNRVTTITAGFGAWAVGGLVLFGDAFIHRWLGDSFAPSYTILLILAVPHAFSIMQYPAYNLLFTIGGQRGLLWLGFIGGLVTAVLSLLFGRAWGTQGVAMALATEGLISSVIGVPLLLHHYCKIQPLRYLVVSILWPGLKALVLPVFCAWLLRSQIVPDYGKLVLCGVAYSLAFALSGPWLLMDAEGRRLISRTFTSR